MYPRFFLSVSMTNYATARTKLGFAQVFKDKFGYLEVKISKTALS